MLGHSDGCEGRCGHSKTEQKNQAFLLPPYCHLPLPNQESLSRHCFHLPPLNQGSPMLQGSQMLQMNQSLQMNQHFQFHQKNL